MAHRLRWLARTVLLVSLAVALAAEDDLEVEDQAEHDSDEASEQGKTKEQINAEFRSELFKDIDPSRIGKTQKLTMDDFEEKKLGPTERTENEIAADANRCGRALECSSCLELSCAWCLSGEQCIADVAGEFASQGKQYGCPGGPDEHISGHENWKHLSACPSHDALKCDECSAIVHQIGDSLASLHRTKKIRHRNPPVISELELLDLFESEVCTPETYSDYGAKVNQSSNELQLSGPGVPGESLKGELKSVGFKKKVMAARCTAIVSDEQDEGEVYRLYKPQRYVDDAVDAVQEAAAEAAAIDEMKSVLCKSDCAVGSGQTVGKKGKKGKKDKKGKKKQTKKKQKRKKDH